MHGYHSNLTREDGKSDVINFYNETKSGVDTLDKVIRGYSSKRKYRRWPCHIFFTLMDCAVFIAHNMPFPQNDLESHYEFKKNLAYELAMPLVKHRATFPKLRTSVKEAMKNVGLDFSCRACDPINTKCFSITRKKTMPLVPSYK